mmetsp:Transcript_165095/g.317069  ORF Transcript_165095/g.317069 Transcript_165095/m.317069 type:complete len:208 (-) Transcript_165095:84-707(-)
MTIDTLLRHRNALAAEVKETAAKQLEAASWNWSDFETGGATLAPGAKAPTSDSCNYLPCPEKTLPTRRGYAGFQVVPQNIAQQVDIKQSMRAEPVFRSYGEWWQAQQKPSFLPEPPVNHRVHAASNWPYGIGVTAMLPTGHGKDRYDFAGNRAVHGFTPHRPARMQASTHSIPAAGLATSMSSPVLQRAGSLLGGRQETLRSQPRLI